jgi:hypothetical protein
MSPASHAADVTDLPERGGLFASLGYGGNVYRGKMEEDGVGIGARVENHHGLNLSAAYGLASGLVFHAQLDYAPATRFVFPDVRPMRFDPATLQGTYRVGDMPSEPLSEDMSGLSGTHIGVRLQPSQWSPNPRPSATKWLVGASFQIPSPNDNLWTHNNGQRGAGTGNLVTRLEASLSKRRGVSDAYTRVLAELGAPIALDIEGANGETLAKNIDVQPPRSVIVQTGLEFDIWGAPAQTLGTLDVSLSTTYLSWGDIASGVYLPEVLTSSQGVVVTRSESVRIGGQIGGHLYDASGWTVHAHGGWTWETPYRPEHVYPDIRMTTANANVHWALTVERRFGPSGVSAAIGDAP